MLYYEENNVFIYCFVLSQFECHTCYECRNILCVYIKQRPNTRITIVGNDYIILPEKKNILSKHTWRPNYSKQLKSLYQHHIFLGLLFIDHLCLGAMRGQRGQSGPAGDFVMLLPAGVNTARAPTAASGRALISLSEFRRKSHDL